MDIFELIRRCVVQVALAGIVWFAVAVAVEKMIPGFISPFINVPGLGLVLAGVGVIAVVVSPPSKTRLSRLPSLLVSVCILIGMLLMLWARMNEVGMWGVVLIGVIGVLAIAFCAAHLSKKSLTE